MEFEAGPNKLIQPFSKYRSFIPYIKELNETDGVNLLTTVCAVGTADGSTLTGEFRVAMCSVEPIRIPISLDVFPVNPLPDIKIYLPVKAQDLNFCQNRWHTEWISLQDELEASNVMLEGNSTHIPENYSDMLTRARNVLLSSDKKFELSFRIEMGSPLENNEIDLNIRLLPASSSFLKNHTRLNSGDVATLNGGSIRTHCTQYSRFLEDIMTDFPVAVTVFCQTELNDKQYCEAVLDGFPSILTSMKAHIDLNFQQAKQYIKSPTAHSGNAIRFKPKRKAAVNSAEYHEQTEHGLLNDDDLQDTLLKARSQIQAQMSHTVGSGTNKSSAPSVIQPYLDQQKQHSQEAQSIFQSNPPQSTRSVFQHPHPPTHQRPSTNPCQQGSKFTYNGSFNNSNMKKYRPTDIIGDVMSEGKFKEMFPNLVDDDGTIDPSYEFLNISSCALENLKSRNKSSKKHSSIEAKLKINSVAITKDKNWAAADDNLKHKIHPIRFDRFNMLSSEELFRRSAEFYSSNPLPAPVSSYDLSNLDLTNKISSKGFEELHCPDSQTISIKMFSPENVKKSAGGMSNFNVVHDEGGNPTVLSSLFLEDIQSVKQFQICFFGLFVGKSRATPWDKSLEALWKFFITHEWLKDIPNTFGYNSLLDQGALCAAFTDSVLQNNGSRFGHIQCHLSYAELDTHFRSFCSSNPKCNYVQMIPVADRSNNANVNNSRSTSNSSPFTLQAAGSAYINIKTICSRFNSAQGCNNKVDNNTKRCHDSVGGGKYLHICNMKMPSKKPCGQLHSQSSHRALT